MRTRSYRHPITILSLGASTGAGTRGQQTRTFLPVGATRAAIHKLTGQEIEYARSITETATYEIEMHYTNRVVPTSRLRFGNRVFNVEAIDNVDERGRVLKCLCSEEKATT